MKKYMFVLNLAILLALAGIYYLHFSDKPRIAFVRSNELVYGYEGMKEAHTLQEAKTQSYQTNFDTLQRDFQKALSEYSLGLSKFSKEEKLEKERVLELQKENLRKYAQSLQESIHESDQKLTEGVLNQINSFVEDYAKKKGYTIIFGTTTSGNILYGEPAIDITKEVLEQLNKNYGSQPNSPGHAH